ncbi:MAG: acyltransferase family protein, partial [Pseudomonadota bacterium]|nr:acyltransferase family protein [Pseudomonadota bacterium]
MKHPAPEPGGSGRARALDGLRGVAACAVVFYHAMLHKDPSIIARVLYKPLQEMTTARDVATKLALTLFNGEIAVTLFFVLSGCVLRLSLDRQRHEPAFRVCTAFALARAIRLYPPVIASLLLFYAMSQLHIRELVVFRPQQFLANATLWAVAMSGPTYTIRIEVLVVPAILAAWLLRRRFGVLALVFCVIYAMLAVEARWMVFGLHDVRAYLLPFMLGMLIAEPLLAPLLESVPARGWWFALAAVIMCRAFAPESAIMGLAALTLAAAFLVGGLLHGRQGSLHHLLR